MPVTGIDPSGRPGRVPHIRIDLAMREGLKLPAMSSTRIFRRLPRWRRIGAAMALLALVFASVAVLPHALAAPAVMQAEAVQVHDHGADHEAAHRHGAAAPADASGSSTAPCETGCATCKDCALCSFATAAPPASLSEGCDFESYASARVPAPADVYPPRLIKPPRL